MELEDVKGLLNQQAIQFKNFQTQDLSKLLFERSAGILQRLIKSIQFEIITCLLFMLVAAALPLISPVLFIKIVSAVSLIYCLCFGFNLLKLQRQINTHDQIMLPTQRAIAALAHLLERFTRIYFLRCIVSVPLLFILSVSVFVYEHPGFLAHPAGLWDSAAFRLFCLGFGLLSLFAWFFAKWYIQQRYGRYLAELQQHLQELLVD
jgi:hypothetical protein